MREVRERPHTSAGLPYLSPNNLSGDMYLGVPRKVDEKLLSKS